MSMKKRIIFPLSILFATFFVAPAFADGQAVFEKSCKMCHATGMAGAPKVGDKSAWKDRIAKGNAALEKSAINGVQGSAGFMPPKGGNPSLSDADVKAAVKYMVDASR